MTRCAIAVLGALLLACGPRGDALLEQRFLAMGTWVDVTIGIEDEDAGSALLAEVEALLRAMERDYYPWVDGELARINAAIARARPVEASPAMARLLATARELALASGGSFDPGIGRLVELWGFDADAPDGPPPERAAIDAWLASGASITALAIDGNTVTSRATSVLVDLGGIAKGAAVDRILELLAANGVANALVNAGGDLRVSGSHGKRPWRVGIKAPRGDGLLGIVELADGESAFTSGDYERYYEDGGPRRHHILDPATGFPVAHTQATTVVATDGTTADAAATALFVAGPERWRSVAETLGIEAALRVDASGEVEMTAAMRDRLQATAGTASDIIAPRP